MTFLIVSVGFTCIVIVVYIIWNIVSQKRVTRQQKELSDARYYELKSKNEFLLACFGVFIAVISFVGYTSINDLKTTLRSEIEGSIASAKDSLSAAISLASQSHMATIATMDRLKELEVKQVQLNSNASVLKESFKAMHSDIDDISKKDILQKDFFVSDSLFITGADIFLEPHFRRIYFNQIIARTGGKLPIFEEPPMVLLTTLNRATAQIISITNEYMDITGEGPIGAVVDKTDKPRIYFNAVIYP